MRFFFLIAASLTLLAGCTPPPPVEQSRTLLWQRYGHHSIDEILLAWNAPARETRLTGGSRLLTYTRAFTFDAASPYEQTTGCEASFIAPPPHFTIENIALKGDALECARLAQNGPGYARSVYIAPGFYPGAYYR
jgi:hypothetical protein